MRPALAALLALAVALPTAAQDRFAATCAASVAAEAVPGLDGAAVCGCAVQTALAGGVAGADLDAAAAALETGEAGTEAVAQAAEVATEALLVCAAQSLMAQEAAGTLPLQTGVTATVEMDGRTVSGSAPLTVTGGSTRRALPPGLRTGDGLGTAEGRRTGKGAPIRIVGQ